MLFSHEFFRVIGNTKKLAFSVLEFFQQFVLLLEKTPWVQSKSRVFSIVLFKKKINPSFLLRFTKKLGKPFSRVFSHVHFSLIAEKTRGCWNQAKP